MRGFMGIHDILLTACVTMYTKFVKVLTTGQAVQPIILLPFPTRFQSLIKQYMNMQYANHSQTC